MGEARILHGRHQTKHLTGEVHFLEKDILRDEISKLQCRNIRWMKMKTVVALAMDKGQRTKDKGHRISQSVIKNKIWDKNISMEVAL